MRLSIAAANCAAIAALLAGCSNPTLGSSALPLTRPARLNPSRVTMGPAAVLSSPMLRTSAPKIFPLMQSMRRAAR